VRINGKNLLRLKDIEEKNSMITKKVLEEAMYGAVVKASTVLPKDIELALEKALEEEKDQLAKLHISTTLENCQIAKDTGKLVCADTGFPLYYIRVGNDIEIEGGFFSLESIAKEVTAKATKDAILRPTMVHPITRKNPGDNIGPHLPMVEVRFDKNIDYLEIAAIPKGGGSEIFGTFYKMMYPADGRSGIIKFILDSVREACWAGKTCPPSVIGVGIGGTADICMRIAKEAAILRPVGSRHPEREIAELEEKLIQALRSLGIGPMGGRGKYGILDLHIEYAMTHTAGLPVAINAQCSLARRGIVRVSSDGKSVSYRDTVNWNLDKMERLK